MNTYLVIHGSKCREVMARNIRDALDVGFEYLRVHRLERKRVRVLLVCDHKGQQVNTIPEQWRK